MILADTKKSNSTIFEQGNNHCRYGYSPNILTDIYDKDINICIWQRQQSDELITAINNLLTSHKQLDISTPVTQFNTYSILVDKFGDNSDIKILSDDISLLIDMFCCLFDLHRAGLRLNTLNKAMCPKFHCDKIPCRLVTTYTGPATQWLFNESVNRSVLGVNSKQMPDNLVGVYSHEQDIQHLNQGDVALLKGENWHGNKGSGLVHRSPSVPKGEKRVILTLDFMLD